MELYSETSFSKSVLSGMANAFLQKGVITGDDALRVLESCVVNHLTRNEHHRYLRGALYALRELHSREALQSESALQVGPVHPRLQPQGQHLVM